MSNLSRTSQHTAVTPVTAAAIVLASLAGQSAIAQCPPTWSDQFAGRYNTLNNLIAAISAFDPDGPGGEEPQIVAAGAFTADEARPILRVARFMPEYQWSQLGAGLDGDVFALQEWDPDGEAGPQSPVLLAGGLFRSSGGEPMQHLAYWNGAAWTNFGQELATNLDAVRSIALLDPDAAGPALPQLYVGTSRRVLTWDGTTWQQVGPTLNVQVRAMCVCDHDGPDGPNPPRFYVGLARSNGSALRTLNGGTWQNVGTTNLVGPINAFELVDDDGDPVTPESIWVGGYYHNAGGVPFANKLARWDGMNWSPIGTQGADVFDDVMHLFQYDPDGSGPIGKRVYSVGDSTAAQFFERPYWVGFNSPITGTTAESVDADADPATPNALYFASAGALRRIDGQFEIDIRDQGAGLPNVVALTTFDHDENASTAEVPAVTTRVGTPADTDPFRIVAYIDDQWRTLGEERTSLGVRLASFDPDGAGPLPNRLISSGSGSVFEWDGLAWSELAPPAPSGVLAFGTGVDPALGEVGEFFAGLSEGRVAVLRDRSEWEILPSPAGNVGDTRAVLQCDLDADGPQAPQIVGLFNGTIQRFDGVGWTTLPTTNVNRAAILVVDDSQQPASQLLEPGLYAIGTGIFRWNGSGWTPEPPSVGELRAATMFDRDGSGPARPRMILRGAALHHYDGERLLTLQSSGSPSFMAVAPATPTTPARLWAGGSFSSIGGVRAASISYWEFPVFPTDLNDDAVIDILDLATLLGSFGLPSDEATDIDESGVVDLADLALLLRDYGTNCN